MCAYACTCMPWSLSSLNHLCSFLLESCNCIVGTTDDMPMLRMTQLCLKTMSVDTNGEVSEKRVFARKHLVYRKAPRGEVYCSKQL